LRQNGYQHLVARACVVINHLIPGKPGVDVADLVAPFQRSVAHGRVVVLPWDKHVAAGSEIEFDLLGRRFQRGVVELAAALADDFETGGAPLPHHRT
jgi:MinD-like ATPase involved in chromosome partitioning or flagellar assembly